MDPLRIAIRVVLVYAVMRVLMRISGKRSVKQASPYDFTIALILGDMMDDAIWAEVGVAMFVVATGVLMLTHVGLQLVTFRSPEAR
jgi:uncharacterized membrane protein YcaP (DUF421 family)